MKHRLAGLFTIVDHQPKRIGYFQLTRNFAGREQQMAEQSVIFGLCIYQPVNRLLRDQQQMHLRLGIDVLDCNAQLVLVNNVGRNLPVDDLGKKSIGHFPCLLTIAIFAAVHVTIASIKSSLAPVNAYTPPSAFGVAAACSNVKSFCAISIRCVALTRLARAMMMPWLASA